MKAHSVAERSAILSTSVCGNGNGNGNGNEGIKHYVYVYNSLGVRAAYPRRIRHT